MSEQVGAYKLRDDPDESDLWIRALVTGGEFYEGGKWLADEPTTIPSDAPFGRSVEVVYSVDRRVYIEEFATREHVGELYVTEDELQTHL